MGGGDRRACGEEEEKVPQKRVKEFVRVRWESNGRKICRKWNGPMLQNVNNVGWDESKHRGELFLDVVPAFYATACISVDLRRFGFVVQL